MSREPQHRVGDPIVVVGTFRSASTLVAEMLGSRPDCHYLGFELSEQISDATGAPFAAPGSDDLRCPPLTAEDATSEQARALRQLLRDRSDVEGVEPGTRLVIKNPHLWHRLGWIRALLPGTRLVATARDLRPCVASLKVLWERSLRRHDHLHHLPAEPDHCWDYVPRSRSHDHPADRTFPGGSVEVLAEFWLRVNRQLAQAADDGVLDAVVRHERTLAEPGRQATQLQEALGLEPVPLDPPEPIQPERQQEWRQRLTPEEHRSLERFVDRHRTELHAIDRRLGGG